MKLPELLTVYRRRREDAERHGSTAPVGRIYTVVIEELEDLELVMPQQMLGTKAVAEILDMAQATVAKKCAAGQFPGAEKTSGENGDWRIPASVVFGWGPKPKDRGPVRRILDE